MFETLIVGYVALKAIEVSANIATWCFNNAAADERAHQRAVINNTYDRLRTERANQREIAREARQKIFEAQQAAHNAHYEMLGEMWRTVQEMRDHAKQVLKQFQQIQDQNREFLRSLPLTPEQRAAIHESNDTLDRGIQRLRAYMGPYLQQFRDAIHEAQVTLKSKEYEYPDYPASALPADFPFAGELLEFDLDELGEYPFVNLGHGQRGRFITHSTKLATPATPIIGLIQRHDRDGGFWILSAAAGELARDIVSGDAYRKSREVMLAESRGDIRLAWWRASGGELIKLQIDFGGLSEQARRAPWGTPIQAHIHAADYFLRTIKAGEPIAREHKYEPWNLPCEAPAEFWTAYNAASQFSDKMLIRESGMQGDPKGSERVLRLANGCEFPIHLDRSAGEFRIGPQCGSRLGLIQEGDRNFFVFLLRGRFHQNAEKDAAAVCRLHDAIRESFVEQRDLSLLAGADSLELTRYKAVLQAEFEISRRRKSEILEFSGWDLPQEQPRGRFLIEFRTAKNFSQDSAVRLSGDDDILGWLQPSDTPGRTLVAVLFEKRRVFRDEAFPPTGKLEAVQVDRDLQNTIDAIENFLSAAASENKSADEQAAFSELRRELLGDFPANEHIHAGRVVAGGEDGLDEHQARAVELLVGTAPLVLIQGPPGTGKTHVIAHAISRILRKNPKARIAMTSQANPAVDEAISKIQESFPGLQIYRDYSAAAKEKYASLDRGVGLKEYYSALIEKMAQTKVNDDPKSAFVQQWLKDAVDRDSIRFEREMSQILSHRSQIVACTLSRLVGISASAPAFDLVIVDEAAKASVPEAMIAANCAKRLALVGDHHQLLPYLDDSYYEHSAPTQVDRELLEKLWNDSLFSRLWERAPESRKAFLATMRRSRKPIAECISSCFYDNALIPGRGHDSPTVKFPLSLIWVDSGGSQHLPAGRTSIKNPMEVELVLDALEQIGALPTKEISVAVIAFHRGQQELLSKEIKRRKPVITPAVLTVDASQGGQWDVVILTLARTHGSSGFVGNPNRLNVAISRAKEICIIIGGRDYAMRDRTRNSCLSSVLHFIEQQPKTGKWGCRPRRGIGIPDRFDFPPPRLPRR
jgi:hypothetical protein